MDLKIGIITSGTMIGMNDILYERTNIFSLKCVSIRGSLKQISAEDFLAKMSRDQQTWKYLNQYALRKDVEMEEFIEKA